MAKKNEVCSAEHAGWFTLPLRRLVQSPQRLLGGLVDPGDTVADLGCGPGYFTLPLATMVGVAGRVIAVDLQAAMLAKLRVRAERAGLDSRIELLECGPDRIGLTTPCDFVLAFYMVHEVPDAAALMSEVHGVLKPGGRFLMVEPKGHVSAADFAATVAVAKAAGLVEAIGSGARAARAPKVAFGRSALFER